MKTPIFVRSLSEKEHETLQGGLRSKDAFTLRRSQMLLASSRREEVPQIAEESGLWPANGAGCHPRLQRQRRGCSDGQIFASEANPRCLRRGKRRGFEGAFASFSERVWPADEPVDALDGRRGCLRGRNNAKAALRRDHPGDALAPSRGEVAAGETLDHLPRPPLREKKRRREYD